MSKSKILILICCINIAYATDNVSEQRVVILSAKAYKSKLLSLNREKYPKAITNPYLYKIYFKDVVLEYGGSVKIPKRISLLVEENSDYMILNEDRVSLVVDVSDTNNFKLLELEKIQSFSCFNSSFLDKKYDEFYYSRSFKNNEYNRPEKLCVQINNEPVDFGY